MSEWFKRLLGPPPPDRVERLLHSCEAYYHAGDHDIAVLLLREVEKELVKTPHLWPEPPAPEYVLPPEERA